jgi:hypothetical protein
MQGAAPERYIIFLTDFQFGPQEALDRDFRTLEAFWTEHDTQKLRHNTLYHVGRRRSSSNQTFPATETKLSS